MMALDPAVCTAASTWFATAARDLPWRRADRTPWGVLVSEVMLQQTPVARALPVWVAWMQRWPTAADVAAAAPSEVIRMWGRLGYPRRGLRLHEAAKVIVERFGGEVPSSVDDLLSLPGVGTYTANAVAAFAFGQRTPVMDVNVARVIARAVDGSPQPPAAVGRTDLSRLLAALPQEPALAVASCAGLMELGAVVCTSRSPDCGVCVLRATCRWLADGQPGAGAAPARTQAWAGTDRQCRGRIMSALRESTEPLAAERIDALWPEQAQRERCLASLIVDGLAHRLPDGSVTLPV